MYVYKYKHTEYIYIEGTVMGPGLFATHTFAYFLVPLRLLRMLPHRQGRLSGIPDKHS